MDRVFVSQDSAGNEVTLRLVKPNQKILQDSNFVSKQAFSKALRNGILTNDEAQRIMKENNLWTDEDEKKNTEWRAQVKELEDILEEGKPSREVGLATVAKLQGLRNQLSDLNLKFTSITDNTAETIAGEAKLHYWAAHCVVYNDSGKKVFPKGVDEFLERGDEQIARDSFKEAMLAHYEYAYGIKMPTNFIDELAENKWLVANKDEPTPAPEVVEPKLEKPEKKKKLAKAD